MNCIRYALMAGGFGVVLVGCGSPGSGDTPLAGAPRTGAVASRYGASSGERVVFTFDGASGSFPTSALVQRDGSGSFSGTTRTGGSANFGTVYRITARGSQRVLLNLGTGKRSFSPAGALIQLGDELYGAGDSNNTCKSHRAASCAGTIFSVGRSGKAHLVYAFKGGTDGAQPVGSLAVLNGALYGTTSFGGKYGLGTVFEITPSGSERVLHSFVKPFGFQPTGSLIGVGGKLYGTTTSGGAYSYGTVFSITPSGKEVVLHNFTGPPDGAAPAAGLAEVDGRLFGTTLRGGTGSYNYCFLSRGNNGCGTVFEIDTSGSEHILYSFNGPPDGASPSAGLTYVDGAFYGTTSDGGTYGCTRHSDCGTIFSVDPSGSERVVYAFSGLPDGAFPYASLIYARGALYGTTQKGGSSACGDEDGCGTIFALTLSSRRVSPK